MTADLGRRKAAASGIPATRDALLRIPAPRANEGHTP
jgi:hypothetical protein